jgi:nucleoside-diphosphate-sugar epimerase
MKVLVIGGSGHIGSYLIPELIKAGHDVTALMRGNKVPYGWSDDIFKKITVINTDRANFIEENRLSDLDVDVICDLIAYELESVKKITSQIKNGAFYLQIGSIWTYENKMYVPVDENHPKNSKGDYGKRKGLIEDYLLTEAKAGKLRACVVHPGHISGKEWSPINPQGNVDMSVYKKLKNGEELILPYLGLNTLHHVHSYDLAKIILACIEKQDVSNGEAFIAVAEHAMTLKAICESLYEYYGQKPNLRFVEWQEFLETVGETNAADTYDHVLHSPSCTVEKAKKLLGVEIKYSIMDIFLEYIEYQGLN